jgi:hypothetical protein
MSLQTSGLGYPLSASRSNACQRRLKAKENEVSILTLLGPKIEPRPNHNAIQSFDLFFMTLGNIAVVGFAQSLSMQMVM